MYVLEFTEEELAVLRGLCRMEYKRKRKQRRQGAVRFGEEFDSSNHDWKLNTYARLYKKFTPGSSGSEFLGDLEADLASEEST